MHVDQSGTSDIQTISPEGCFALVGFPFIFRLIAWLTGNVLPYRDLLLGEFVIIGELCSFSFLEFYSYTPLLRFVPHVCNSAKI